MCGIDIQLVSTKYFLCLFFLSYVNISCFLWVGFDLVSSFPSALSNIPVMVFVHCGVASVFAYTTTVVIPDTIHVSR